MGKRSKVLVTGASGTIGTHLCEALLEKGYDVVGVDYRPNQWNEEIGAITIDQDLRDRDGVMKNLPTDVDAIVHLAANARVYNLVVDPVLARDNFETVFNTIEFARRNNIPKFIFSSSREVYGNTDKVVHAEDDADMKHCESAYTATKIGGEALVHAYRRCYDMDAVIVRFSNVYGKYDESDRFVPLVIKKCLMGEDITIFGKEKLLDFTYISDAVGGVIGILEKFDDVKNDVYNLAYSGGATLVSVAEKVRDMLAAENEIIIKDNRVGEVVKYVADISRARERIGYEPQVHVDEGLRRSVDWYTANLFRDLHEARQLARVTPAEVEAVELAA
jgi:UDP-glucose 4-epimerase